MTADREAAIREVERLLASKHECSPTLSRLGSDLLRDLLAELAAVREERDAARNASERRKMLNRDLIAQLATVREALAFYAELGPDDIPYADTINDPPDVGRVARAALAAAEEQA